MSKPKGTPYIMRGGVEMGQQMVMPGTGNQEEGKFTTAEGGLVEDASLGGGLFTMGYMEYLINQGIDVVHMSHEADEAEFPAWFLNKLVGGEE